MLTDKKHKFDAFLQYNSDMKKKYNISGNRISQKQYFMQEYSNIEQITNIFSSHVKEQYIESIKQLG